MDEDDLLIGATEQHKRRKSDTAIGAMKERAGKVLLGYGSTGVFSLVLLIVGGVYFNNAEKRSQKFIDEQRETINLQNKALADVSRESTNAISKNTEVMQSVQHELRELRRDRNGKPPDWPDTSKKPTNLEEYK